MGVCSYMGAEGVSVSGGGLAFAHLFDEQGRVCSSP